MPSPTLNDIVIVVVVSVKFTGDAKVAAPMSLSTSASFYAR